MGIDTIVVGIVWNAYPVDPYPMGIDTEFLLVLHIFVVRVDPYPMGIDTLAASLMDCSICVDPYHMGIDTVMFPGLGWASPSRVDPYPMGIDTDTALRLVFRKSRPLPYGN